MATYIQSGTGANLTLDQVRNGNFPAGTFFIESGTGKQMTQSDVKSSTLTTTPLTFANQNNQPATPAETPAAPVVKTIPPEQYQAAISAMKTGAYTPAQAKAYLQNLNLGTVDTTKLYVPGGTYIQDGQTYQFGNDYTGTGTKTTTTVYKSTTSAGTGDTSSTTDASVGGITNKSTGDPTIDAAQNQILDYVTGTLASGYTINPALKDTSLAAMLPTFIHQTAQILAPELQQNFATKMQSITQALQTNFDQYSSTQGNDIYQFQQGLANLMNTANPNSAATGAAARAMADSENRTLSSLDATYTASQGGVLQAGGEAFGNGGVNSYLNDLGISSPGGTYTAGSLSAPNANPLRVGVTGGNTVLAGSTTAGNELNYNYNPSIYTYGSIPTNFGTNFGTTLKQLFGNYQKGAAATPNTMQGSGITSSSGLT